MDDLLSIGTGLLRNATDATVAGEKEMADERVYAYSGSRAITVSISSVIVKINLPELSRWPTTIRVPRRAEPSPKMQRSRL